LCAERLYLVADGQCLPYDGDMDAYRKLVLSESGMGIKSDVDAAPRQKNPSRKDERRANAAARAEQTQLRRAAKDAETKLEKLTTQRTRLEMVLADPQLYEKEPNRLPDLLREQGEIIKKIEEAEAAWLEAQEALEDAAAE
jgi:ATP-binding cassette subfamily F protein 3